MTMTYRAARDCFGRVLHLNLEDVAPEGAKVHVVVAAIKDQVAVNRIIVLSSGRFDTGGAEVGPGAVFEGRRGRNTDSGVLGSEGGNGVVQIVGVAYERDIWRLWPQLDHICTRGRSMSYPKIGVAL